MRAIVSLAVLIAGLFASAASARTMSDFFIGEPDSVFVQIDKSARMDMVDYFHSGKKVDTMNRLGGKSRIEELTDDYMRVRLSDCAEVAIHSYIAGNDTLLLVVNTLKTPALDSQVMTFVNDWTPMDAGKYIRLPQVEDFITGVSGKQRKQLAELVEFPLMSLTVKPDGKVEACLTVNRYMGTEDYARLKPYLKESIIYSWDGKKFRVAK